MTDSLPDPKPWAHQRGAVKLIECVARRLDLSSREFHLYWQRHHSPHVMNCTAFSQYMRKYTTTHVTPDLAEGLAAGYELVSNFEGAAEIWIDGLDELGAWLGHPLSAELIQPDEARFIDLAATELLLVREQAVFSAELDLHEGDCIKMLTLLRRRPALDRDAFHRRLGALADSLASGAPERSPLRKLVVSHRLCDPTPEGFPMAPIDAVGEFWLDSAKSLREFMQAPAFREFHAELTELVEDGPIRTIVGRVHVVHDEYSFQPSVTHPLEFQWEGRRIRPG